MHNLTSLFIQKYHHSVYIYIYIVFVFVFVETMGKTDIPDYYAIYLDTVGVELQNILPYETGKMTVKF